jgi:hypothetical protein
MPTLTLELPSAGGVITSGLHAANYADIQALLNGGLDGSNINQATVFTLGASGITLGADVNLYRAAASVLKTDGTLRAGGAMELTGATGAFIARSSVGVYPTLVTRQSVDAFDRYSLDNNGVMIWGGGSGTGDTNLYRWEPNILATDDGLRVGADLHIVTDSGKLFFGTATDTSLYRGGANTLKTDDQFHAVGSLYAGWNAAAGSYVLQALDTGQVALPIQGATGGLLLGGDVNLYRSAANALKTDDDFYSGGSIIAAANLAARNDSGAIVFGLGDDVGMARSGANELSMFSGDTLKMSAAGIKFNDNTVQTTAATGYTPAAPATSLPGSPTNGQIAILTDNTSTPTYAWTFQWSSTASKWFFIGGSPAQTAGTTFTIPRAGVYVVRFGAIGTVAVNVGTTIRLNKNSGTSVGSLSITMVSTSGSVSGSSGGNGEVRLTLAASDTLVVDANGGSISSASLAVVPVYVT